MYKYQEISQKIRQDILSGKYYPGAALPDQNQIASDFKTTRMTVRKAINELVIAGLLYSKRGAGTFVRKDFQKNLAGELSNIQKPLGTTKNSPDQNVTSKILHFSARMPTEVEQDKLLLSPAEPVYEIERLRYIEEKLFSYEHTIMPTKIAILSDKILHKSIYTYLKNKCGLTIGGAHRIVTAQKSTPADIKNQIASEGDPVLVIQQVGYLEDGQPFEFSDSRFPYQDSQVIADIEL